MHGLTLLIVDDETATREGLKAALDFERLGISRVLEAENGAEGLRTASSASPDIILSDVRMPRMDGVRMLERVRTFLPDCVFIFMSGYSDKEYLKAAIKLRAVSYIEKPLHFPEVEQAVREAVALCEELDEQKNAVSVKDNVSLSRLAIRLTAPGDPRDSADLSYLKNRYGKNILSYSAASMILQLRDDASFDAFDLSPAEQSIRQLRTHDPLRVFSAEKHPGMFVLHILREGGLKPEDVRDSAEVLAGLFRNGPDFYITCGVTVSSAAKLYDSFSSAAILMEQAFFHPVNSIYSGFEKNTARGSDPNLESVTRSVLDALEKKDPHLSAKVFEDLFDALSRNTVFPRHTVKAAYYHIASVIIELRRSSHLPPTELTANRDTFIYAISSCFSFEEMHRLLVSEAEAYYRDLDSVSPESTQVYMIREYIRAHYDDPFLSTKEISDYIMLSASYACTIFKTETGKTLNQYLTEYRMEQAKKLLADPRITITAVSSRCGYNDSNYFGKAFRKYTGLSPSEYRESLTGVK